MLRSKIQYVTRQKEEARKEEDWPKNWEGQSS